MGYRFDLVFPGRKKLQLYIFPKGLRIREPSLPSAGDADQVLEMKVHARFFCTPEIMIIACWFKTTNTSCAITLAKRPVSIYRQMSSCTRCCLYMNVVSSSPSTAIGRFSGALL